MNATRATSRQVFVVDRHTGLFLGGDGYWTPDAAAARDFGTTPDAVAHCVAQRMGAVQIAICRSEGEKERITFSRLPAHT